MTTPYVLIKEETGDVPVPAPPIDAVAAYLGTASAGTNNTPTLFGKAAALASFHGEGPGVRQCGYVLKKTNVPSIFCRVPSSNPGAYKTIDVSKVTGTALVRTDATSIPLNDEEAWIKVVNGGTIGAAGITFQYSRTNGRNRSGVLALGSAYNYTIPGTAVKFLFDPPLAPLITLATEIRTDLLAHMNLTAGAVHGAADATSVALIVFVAAITTQAEAITVLNQCRAAYEAHRVRIAGAVHGAADNTVGSVIVAPVATDGQSAITLALDLKAKINAHEQNTAGGVHGAPDGTNQISSPDASRGTLNAGDIFSVVTTGPKWASGDLTAGFNALAESSLDFSLVYVAGPCSASEAAVITAGLNTLKGAGKRVGCVLQARQQGDGVPGETEAQWIAALALDFANYFDDRVSVCAGSAYFTIDDGVNVNQFNTTFAPAYMARIIEIDRFVSPGEVDDGPLENVSLEDESGNRIGHDESWIGGLDEARFVALWRIPDPQRRRGAYISHPYVMKPADGRISQFQVRRVTNAAERVAASQGFSSIGKNTLYDPVSHLMGEGTALAITNKIREPLSSEFANDISNPQDEKLVEVNRSVTVSGDSVFVEITVNLVPFKYIGGITITFSLKV